MKKLIIVLLTTLISLPVLLYLYVTIGTIIYAYKHEYSFINQEGKTEYIIGGHHLMSEDNEPLYFKLFYRPFGKHFVVPKHDLDYGHLHVVYED